MYYHLCIILKQVEPIAVQRSKRIETSKM